MYLVLVDAIDRSFKDILKLTDLYILFSFGTFNSFLADLGRHRVYSACCSAQKARKSVINQLSKENNRH